MLEIDLEICRILAKEAYDGYDRRDGSSMYEHAIRVSNLFARMGSTPMAAAALLHDVLPHTETAKKDLVDAAVMGNTIELLINYMKKDDESVLDYYDRLGADPILRHIKMADIVEDLLCEPTEEEYREWQYGLMILSRCPMRLLKKEPIYDYLEVPGEFRK